MSGKSPTLILASASPRRLDLLAQIGIVPDAIKPADINEAPIDGEIPHGHALRLAQEKAVKVASKNMISRVVETRLKMKTLSLQEIDNYIDSGEWKGKAGGYGIQGRASIFIPSIIGSYTNVVGLPLFETRNLLTGAGYPS